MFAKTFPGLLEAFLTNIYIFAWCAPLIAVLGLVIAYAVMCAHRRSIPCASLAPFTRMCFWACR